MTKEIIDTHKSKNKKKIILIKLIIFYLKFHRNPIQIVFTVIIFVVRPFLNTKLLIESQICLI
jgi:hypothetical protein